MSSSIVYRSASLLALLLVISYYAWITVVPFGYAGAPIAAIAMLGLVVATLKVGVREPRAWWQAADTSQTGRVMLLILTGMICQLTIGWGLREVGRFSQLTSTIVYLVVWTSIPLLFIAMGWVRWPHRLASPSWRALLPAAAAILLVATGTACMGGLAYTGPQVPPKLFDYAIGGAATLLGATMEEIVFRVLLLTAIAAASKSRTQALILSSVVFALYHVPGSVSVPLFAGDWPEVETYARDFLPDLVWTTGYGFFFGAVWLRTGSITLVCLAHAICNFGQIAVGGLDAL